MPTFTTLHRFTIDHVRWLRCLRYAAFAALAIAALVYLEWEQGLAQRDANSSRIRLGRRLFNDDRFNSANGDLPSSCSSCHMFDENAQGPRAYTDFLARSWVPWRSKDPRRDGVRNAPTLLDAGDLPFLHYDGEFASLEELVRGTLSGRTMGWMPDERTEALNQVCRVLRNDTGTGPKADGTYVEQFRNVYGVDLKRLPPDEIIRLASSAIADYVRTLKTKRNSPYDRFVSSNGLEVEPARGESSEVFAARMMARVTALEAERQLKFVPGFGLAALEGMKIFFRSEGQNSVGSCVSCHAPPRFTDYSFHNIGISQSDCDKVHGEGTFAAKSIPGAKAVRPQTQFRETPSLNKPDNVDLGYWSFVSLTDSPLRRPGESDDQFLQRMIGTFKTPTLRNLALSEPYMHNGNYASLESVLTELMRLSSLARAGKVRSADDGLSKIRITEADVHPLLAFLDSLNESLKGAYPLPVTRNRRPF